MRKLAVTIAAIACIFAASATAKEPAPRAPVLANQPANGIPLPDNNWWLILSLPSTIPAGWLCVYTNGWYIRLEYQEWSC